MQNWNNGLWEVCLQPPEQKENMIIRKDKTKNDLAEYLHKSAFSPTLSTFKKQFVMVMLLLFQLSMQSTLPII